MGWLGRSRRRVAPSDAKQLAGHAANAYTMTEGDITASHHIHASPSASAISSGVVPGGKAVGVLETSPDGWSRIEAGWLRPGAVVDHGKTSKGRMSSWGSFGGGSNSSPRKRSITADSDTSGDRHEKKKIGSLRLTWRCRTR